MSYVNEAAWDRIARVVLGAVLLYLGWAGVVTGPLGVVFRYLGFLPLITGIVGWCPAYALLRIRTDRS
jgi:hypothetical protein